MVFSTMTKMKMIKIVIVAVVKRHVTKNTSLKGEIMIDIPMVSMKIVANSREERYVMKKDVIVKRHAPKNMGSRQKIKVFGDAVVKRETMKNVDSRWKIDRGCDVVMWRAECEKSREKGLQCVCAMCVHTKGKLFVHMHK